MDSLNEQDGYDPAAKVRLFLDALAVHFVEESIVARLCSLLLVVFRDIIQKLTDSKLHADEKAPVSISLQRSLDRLKLWSDGYRICAGDQDVNFIKSGRLRRATMEILVSISDTLLERLEPLTSSKKTQVSDTAEESVQKLKEVLEAAHKDLDHDTSSSDSSSYYGSDNLEEIAKDLETDTLSLMGLDALFQSAALESFTEKAAFADATQTWLPHDVYKDRIRTRFPKAESSLVSRLSKTSYDRYLRCQQERESQTTAVGDVDFPRFTRSDAASSKFQDSGLGTSIPSSASVAETVMSYRAEGKASVRIPPLSKEAKEGQPFECISCGKTLSIQNNSVWKRHLYQDLLPWQCLDPDCSFTTVFQTREDWIAHIAQDHKLEPDWKSTTCPLCLDTIPTGRLAVTKHLCNHLEEISLAALPTNLDFESHSGSDNDSDSSKSQEENMDETKGIPPTTEGDETMYPPERSVWPQPPESGYVAPKSGLPGGIAEEQEPVLQDALDYLDQVKLAFHDRPAKYNRFLDIMKDFKAEVIDTPGVMRLVTDLFVAENQVQLVAGFNSFLPPGYAIDKNLNFRMPGDPVSNFYLGRLEGANEPSSAYRDTVKRLTKRYTSPNRKTKEEGPVTFDTSIAYVNKVKNRYQDVPETYRQFLEILQKYQREETPIKDVYTSVATLFESAPDLLDDFKKLFLPNVSATQQQQHQPPQPHLGFIVDTYDPDEEIPRGTPLMTPLRAKLEPSPSPPPDIDNFKKPFLPSVSATQHYGFVVDTYDPDDVLPRGSPLTTPLRPRFEPSPSPPPDRGRDERRETTRETTPFYN